MRKTTIVTCAVAPTDIIECETADPEWWGTHPHVLGALRVKDGKMTKSIYLDAERIIDMMQALHAMLTKENA